MSIEVYYFFVLIGSFGQGRTRWEPSL